MKWEYFVETIQAHDPMALNVRLGDLGSDGWELVTVVSGQKLILVLKRPKVS